MKLSEVIEKLEHFCPPSFAEDWDNVGLLCGRGSWEIERVLLAVDATSDVIEEARERGADLILTHHPLIFHGLKSVTEDDFIGRRILEMIERGIACYAMHTNFDILGMADAAADELHLLEREVLSVTYEDDVSREGLGRVGKLPEHMTLLELAQTVKENFAIPSVRVYGELDTPIITAALLPGSGSDYIDEARRHGADVMITGDMTHHKGMDAVEKGICVIDAGHYGVEKLFLPYMASYLKREMPDLMVYQARDKAPFVDI